MAIPIIESSVIASLALGLIWAYLKFVSDRHKPHSGDVVDFIALLLLGPVLVIGGIFIIIALGLVPLSSIEGLFIHLGISGGILIGAVMYFFYITLNREEHYKKEEERRHELPNYYRRR